MAKKTPLAGKNKISRVYFIGAGLSAGLYYPVGNDLMKRLVGYLKGQPEHKDLEKNGFANSVNETAASKKKASQILQVIERVLKRYFATNLVSIQHINIAEFFTIAYTLSENSWLIPGISDSTKNKSASEALTIDATNESQLFQSLSCIIRTYFHDIGIMFSPAEDIKKAIDNIRPEIDAIVNFNWDEEIDMQISAMEKNIAYTFGAWLDEGGYLNLKPHGSVGWYDINNGIGNKEAYFIAGNDDRIPRYKKRILSYNGNNLPMDIEGDKPHSSLACPPVITAPTFAKRFDYIEQHMIWQDVLKVCGEATEFIFLGYSLPKDDFLTRAAIRSAIHSSNSNPHIKCLVVDKYFDELKILNFQSVFKGFTLENNYLEWNFGSEDPTLADQINLKLQNARLLN